MTDVAQDIDDLFSMFHDVEIVGLDLKDEVLRMEILLPWCEMWGRERYSLTFELGGCKGVTCQYHVRTGNEVVRKDGKVFYPTDEYLTSDRHEIARLGLDVLGSSFDRPDRVTLHCERRIASRDHEGVIEYAGIEFQTTSYRIFDDEMNEISLDTMKGWAEEWWEGIQKMWDAQKPDGAE